MPVLRQKLLTDFFRLPEKPKSINGEAGPSVTVVPEEQDHDDKQCESASSTDQEHPSAGPQYAVLRRIVIFGKENRKKRKHLDDSNQMILDAGQKLFGHQCCNKCGMVYDCDSLSDCKKHNEFHNRFISTEWFRVSVSQVDSWKRSVFCVAEVLNGVYSCIFRVTQTNKCTLKKRIEQV
ncbi:unnamed protein product [Gongylonema pulchrum]|uniref:Zf-C2H2_3 domain-containing protein n=1 Tax=Gongylonema pulchrum TaxID=637853 RepID=A0A183D8M6_9BILA|nr:unnamed protein product [Gongylonema pulchrum]